ncbi:MAG: PepSY domain-containing protein [Phycisphaerae bacterium]
MPARKKWFFIHRWLALIVSLQLLAWSIGGFVFSILDIEDVRGNTDRASVLTKQLSVDQIAVTPREAMSAAKVNGLDQVTRIVLTNRLDRLVYELYKGSKPSCRVDATTGEFQETISQEDAKRIALSDFKHEANVRSVQLITENPPGEYRGELLPAYQVILDHPREPHIYLSAVTGAVTKRRNSLWRTFDFFWMLHIMDYRGRQNFNHWLLSAMSVMAILTSSTGLVLWWWRIPRRRKREVERAEVAMSQ